MSDLSDSIDTKIVPNKYTRFKDASWFETIQNQELFIGGAGGISSWLALAIASAGCENITIIDFDTVEEVNLAGQFFKKSQINTSKVRAVYDNIIDFCDLSINMSNSKIEKDTVLPFTHILTGFDKMLPRELTFKQWCKTVDSCLTEKEKRNCIYMDGRLTAEQIQIFTIIGTDELAKEEYLTNHIFSDNTIEDAPCTFKQTRFLAMKIAGIMTEIYTNYLANISTEVYGPKQVPFFFQTYTPLMNTVKINKLIKNDDSSTRTT